MLSLERFFKNLFCKSFFMKVHVWGNVFVFHNFKVLVKEEMKASVTVFMAFENNKKKKGSHLKARDVTK